MNGEPSTYPYQPATWGDCGPRAAVPVTISRPYAEASPPTSDDTTVDEGLVQPRKRSHLHDGMHSYDQPDSLDMLEQEEGNAAASRVAPHNQRTILITNLSDRTTHKDLAEIIRGGRLLDIFLRNDRSANISFVEGAADFLAYAKRNDIYLHTKRLEFRWNDKQFKVPTHVFNKIANGATRNLVIRGAAGKVSADQIREHLDHIHNLVVSCTAIEGEHLVLLTWPTGGRCLLQRWRRPCVDKLDSQRSVRQDLYDVEDLLQKYEDRLVRHP